MVNVRRSILLVFQLGKRACSTGALAAFDIHQNKMYCFGYFIVAYQTTPKLRWLKIIADD